MTSAPGAPLVTAVIVNYESSDMVKRCVESLEHQEVPHEVIVVDNPSPENDAERLEGLKARIIHSRENVGYGCGNNLGAAAGSGAYVCVLNPDTLLAPGILDAWVGVHERETRAGRRIGLLAPRLLNDNGSVQRSVYDFVNPLNYWMYHSIAAGALKALRKSVRISAPENQASGVEAVDWVMGAALLVPREAWNAVGGFGENYFLYAEDTDLCRRLRDAGWEVCYAPEVSIVHTQGDPAPDKRAARIVRLFDGIRRFTKQHYSPVRRFGIDSCIVLDMLLRIAMFAPLLVLRPNDPLARSRVNGARQVLRDMWNGT